MERKWCPKCQAVRDVKVTKTKAVGPMTGREAQDGKLEEIVTKTVQCSSCLMVLDLAIETVKKNRK